MVPERVRRIVALSEHAGFTMTELLVVVAILAIVATLSIPSWWTYARTAALRNGAEELAAVLNGARQLAIRTNATVCVTNDGTRAQYRVGACEGPAWTGIGTDPEGHISLANHLRVSGTPHLCFNYLGAGSATPSPCAANGTLTVTNPSGDRSLSVVMATTGRVRIQ